MEEQRRCKKELLESQKDVSCQVGKGAGHKIKNKYSGKKM
jgi:hypothetical protein